MPLKVISESLGHSSIGVTSAIYVHLLDQTKRDAADAFEAYVGSPMTPRPKAMSESRSPFGTNYSEFLGTA